MSNDILTNYVCGCEISTERVCNEKQMVCAVESGEGTE